MKFATKVIHAGVEPDAQTGAVMTPIYQTSTYAQAAPGNHKGYEYARTQNPTRTVLEANLAALENGTHGICFGSGMAAMDAVLKLLSAGDEIVAINDLYGGSYRLITKVYERFGMKGHFVPMYNAEHFGQYMTEKTKLVWIETPTNPMLKIVDIEAICKIAKKNGAMVCVDNTFASPYLQTPLDLGADIVLHSATKYLGGHADSVHGALVVKDQELASRLYFIQNSSGAVPGPMDCFLILRGIKTLHLRMDRACQNAEKIALFLKGHPKVANVYYPGFEDHPGHDIAKKQMKKGGNIVSFEIKGGIEAGRKFIDAIKLCSRSANLGDTRSIVTHPASTTHSKLSEEDRLEAGIKPGLVRVSVGLEHADDVIADLKQALNSI